MYTKTNN